MTLTPESLYDDAHNFLGNMMADERLAREKKFHNERFGSAHDPRHVTAKYYSIMGEARLLYKKLGSESSLNPRLLEYGCATGDQSVGWLETGARVTGIDISSEAIQKARQRVKGTRHESQAEFLEMNAESLDFSDNSFDVVVGNGIIHHLDLNTCYAELARVLKCGGRAVFMEPMGHNPLINLYRKLTPSLRTEDEHPLKQADIELAGRYFEKVESTHFNLFTLLAIPLRKTSLFEPFLKFLSSVDRMAFHAPFFRRQAWFVVILLKNPRKTKTSK